MADTDAADAIMSSTWNVRILCALAENAES
jgi:hypothetical protein